MAELSDLLLKVAIFAYLAAMVGYLVEYAFGGPGLLPRIAVHERELVAAAVDGNAAAADGTSANAAAMSESQPRSASVNARADSRTAFVGLIAVALTVAATLVHAGVLVTRGLAAGRVPWGNMYEFVIALSLVGAVTWLLLLARMPVLRPLGVFVTMAICLILGLAAMVLHTAVAPLVPALNSYWLKIHVTAAATASGLLLVAFVPAALFLVRTGYDRGKRRFPYTLATRLPAAETLDVRKGIFGV